MKRTLAWILVVTMALALMIPAAAMAQSNGGNGGYAVGRSAHTWGAAGEIKMRAVAGGACVSWQAQRLYRMVNEANLKIAILVRYAQITPWNDVAWLLGQVDSIVDEVMDYAGSIGATVQCVYTEYYIDGQYVLIDPLKVIDV